MSIAIIPASFHYITMSFLNSMHPALTARKCGRVVVISLLAASISCQTPPQMPQGPQPFMIISVSSGDITSSGTLAPKMDFDFWRKSLNGADEVSVSMQASLIETTPGGYRISWNAQKIVNGEKIVNWTTQEVVPWGKSTSLDSVPGYSVEAYYSPVTADQLN